MNESQAVDEDPTIGLTAADVAARIARGQVNTAPEPPGRSVGQIVRANVFTTVNAIMLFLFGVIVLAGYWRDGLFVGVVVSNSVIGVTQEVRARRHLARLTVLAEPEATVIRDGERHVIAADGVVIDDTVQLARGDQASVDGTVLASAGLQFDESMLTGESLAVAKTPGDAVLSGSYVVAGSGFIRATAVGAASYAGDLTIRAKRFEAAHSQLRESIDRILTWLTVIIPVASSLLLVRLLISAPTWQEALQGTVAAAVAMVPDGLVLLTSLTFVASMVALARRHVLAKGLNTVEILARVDTLCLDKTGTITTGMVAYVDAHAVGSADPDEVVAALASLAATDDNPNSTMQAIATDVGDRPGWQATSIEPFSSARKWSAAEFAGRGWYYLGGADVIDHGDPRVTTITDELSAAGKRLLVLASGPTAPDGDSLPTDLSPLAVIELEDEIRPDANEIFAYFVEQGVRLVVISGDQPETVGAIAGRAGLEPRGEAIDARDLPDGDAELARIMEHGDCFGRVQPAQKEAMVAALQSNGHVVAMTGDGVNDVLALKAADLGIAMGSGSGATRSVADLVLVDDRFATMPDVVREGRKVLSNVEVVSNLFLSKAVYAVLLTLAVGVIGSPFPFLPRHLTLVGTFSIGVPGMVLALAPEANRFRSGFLGRVLVFSIPAGIIAGTATLAAYEVARRTAGLTLTEARTLSTVTLLAIGLSILVVVSRPLRVWKILLSVTMGASYVAIMAIPWLRDFFELDLFPVRGWLIGGFAAACASVAIAAVPPITARVADTSPGRV